MNPSNTLTKRRKNFISTHRKFYCKSVTNFSRKKSFELLDYFFHICIQTNFLQDRKSWNYNKEKSEGFLIVYHLEQLYNIKYNWHKACLESSWKHSVQRKYHFSAMPWSLLLNLLSVCQDELTRRKIRKNWPGLWFGWAFLIKKKKVLYLCYFTSQP